MVTSKTIDGVLYFFLEGELDEDSASEVRGYFDRVLDGFKGKKVLIDLKNLTFMDSTGIGVLLGRYKRLAEKGVRIYLSSPTPAVDRILKLSGIYQLMSKIER